MVGRGFRIQTIQTSHGTGPTGTVCLVGSNHISVLSQHVIDYGEYLLLIHDPVPGFHVRL